MSGRAALFIEGVGIVPIEWVRDPESDARPLVPVGVRPFWDAAARSIRREHADGSDFRPFAGSQVSVPILLLERSVLGLYGVASRAWGRRVRWSVAPPRSKRPLESGPPGIVY